MKRTLITCMITSMITGMTIPYMIDIESTKTATQSKQETTTETTVNNLLNGIDITGFETEIYYINSADDVQTGDTMETVLVYNPSNNFIDDVMYRADTFIE